MIREGKKKQGSVDFRGYQWLCSPESWEEKRIRWGRQFVLVCSFGRRVERTARSESSDTNRDSASKTPLDDLEIVWPPVTCPHRQFEHVCFVFSRGEGSVYMSCNCCLLSLRGNDERQTLDRLPYLRSTWKQQPSTELVSHICPFVIVCTSCLFELQPDKSLAKLFSLQSQICDGEPRTHCIETNKKITSLATGSTLHILQCLKTIQRYVNQKQSKNLVVKNQIDSFTASII